MKSNLIVSGWLHPFEGGEFRLKLFIIADDRFVVAFAADFVAGRRKDWWRAEKTWSNLLGNIKLCPLLAVFTCVGIDEFHFFLLLFRFFLWNHHCKGKESTVFGQIWLDFLLFFTRLSIKLGAAVKEFDGFWVGLDTKQSCCDFLAFICGFVQTFSQNFDSKHMLSSSFTQISTSSYTSKSSLSVPLVIASSDTINSPYDDVNKFFVFVPSARIFGSRSSGFRLVMRLMSDDQKLVALGAKIGAWICVGWEFLSLVMVQGTWSRA